ncbi:beta-mannosidase [Frondihabitans sp. PAMC 28766]|uniref:cellulase family glycosylhydrolase n=1 Tax=Frondihabitans sp. PAMC 28766 TaxID=1795630 RepID=UPI00078C91D2|nr:cellulase family glycosylhydrolase [Frondihabitans sp. PAMC 28766]AMM21576.1 beta-mannosidase [Frondihabitans sp. PAMC 28766]
MKRHSAKLIRDGEPVTWIGVNFWSRVGGPRMWRDYDPEVVGNELDVMRDHGMTVTRSFFYWHDFMPTPDALDETLVERFRDFLDQHEARGMTTIPTFLVGHMSGQNWDPAWRGDRELYSDVWFVAKQAWYVRELTSRFASHLAVAGWLLSNEIPIYGDWRSRGIGTNNFETVNSWAQILIDAVKLGGATQPISIGDGAWGREVTGTDNGFRVRDLAPLVDFHGPHVYRMETDQIRQNLGAAFIAELLDIGGKPVIMEEFGLTSDYVSEAHAADYYRQVLHNTLLGGATGWLVWNNTDYDALVEAEPYSHHPFEMHFGVTDRDGRPKEQAREVKRFAELSERVGFGRLTRPDAEAVLVVSSFQEADYPFTQPQDATIVFETGRQAYIAAREADLPLGVARELDGIPTDAALYILPSAKQLLAPSWVELRRLAAAGATVYASVFLGEHGTQRGPWWPDLDETFGVTKQSRYGLVDPVVDDELRVTVVSAFGGLSVGDELVFPVAGTANSRAYLPVVPTTAEVLAVDQRGRPAFLRNRVGDGWMVLGTYPIEYFASAAPFVNPEPTWRLYDALATEAGVRRDVTVPDPIVSASEMVHDDGTRYVWFVSQSDAAVTVTPALPSGSLETLDGDAVTSVDLAPFGVMVAILRASCTVR